MFSFQSSGNGRRFVHMIRSAALALYRAATREKIFLSDTLYIRAASSAKFTVVSLALENIQAMKSSLAQVRQIFDLFEATCEGGEQGEIKIGDQVWSMKPQEDPELMKIGIYGPYCSASHIVRRRDIVLALSEFRSRFA
jgi:hypothetical protein